MEKKASLISTNIFNHNACYQLVVLFIFFLSSCASVKEENIRIATYNIRNAIGLDDSVNYARIANVINKINPDIIALQELDSVTNRSDQVDVLSTLSQLTGMNAVYGASIDFDGGKYGIGVMSKVKPLSWKHIPLPGREEKRSALFLEFETYIFICSHFSLTSEDRMASVDIINGLIENIKKPVFFAGDLNATPDSQVMQVLLEKWQLLSDIEKNTFPADNPNRTIDFILGSAQSEYTLKMIYTETVNEQVASDHLPVFSDIQIKKQP